MTRKWPPRRAEEEELWRASWRAIAGAMNLGPRFAWPLGYVLSRLWRKPRQTFSVVTRLFKTL
jgi:hypothetical protein